MDDSSKPVTRKLILIVIAAVAGLGIIFALLSTIGDDVPNDLPPATQSSPGD